MKQLMTVISGALLMTLSAPQVMAESVNDQVAAFRAERNFIDRAYNRCNELVAQKYRDQLYGPNAVNGEKRKPIEAALENEWSVCKANHTRKASTLYEKQSPEVHAFYAQRSSTLKKDAIAIDKEATR
ncbi:hypothetical protein QB888_003109 [Escherichia coli]|nr:hypothetical protein [Escherichia coli]